MKDDSRELRTMRMMAWERAKGELKSMLCTFWEGGPEGFTNLKEVIDDFVKKVEDDGLRE